MEWLGWTGHNGSVHLVALQLRRVVLLYGMAIPEGSSRAVLLKVQNLQCMFNVQETYCIQIKAHLERSYVKVLLNIFITLHEKVHWRLFHRPLL